MAKKIGKQIYKLNLSPDFKVYLVFYVYILKSFYTNDKDSGKSYS